MLLKALHTHGKVRMHGLLTLMALGFNQQAKRTKLNRSAFICCKKTPNATKFNATSPMLSKMMFQLK